MHLCTQQRLEYWKRKTWNRSMMMDDSFAMHFRSLIHCFFFFGFSAMGRAYISWLWTIRHRNNGIQNITCQQWNYAESVCISSVFFSNSIFFFFLIIWSIWFTAKYLPIYRLGNQKHLRQLRWHVAKMLHKMDGTVCTRRIPKIMFIITMTNKKSIINLVIEWNADKTKANCKKARIIIN